MPELHTNLLYTDLRSDSRVLTYSCSYTSLRYGWQIHKTRVGEGTGMGRGEYVVHKKVLTVGHQGAK